MSTADPLRLVAATANRLRLIQVDFADESPEVRREYLSEEVRRALTAIVPGERAAFLQALMERFPTWDASVALPSGAAEAPVRPPTDERELKDWSFLVARLAALAPTLSEADREAVLGRLREARLVPEASAAEWPEAEVQDLRSRLLLDAPAPIDAKRVLAGIGLLADLAVKLDKILWTTWHKIARRAAARRSADFLKTVGSFISGDEEVPRSQMAHDLEELRSLAAALIGALGKVAADFANQYRDRFAPARIKQVVQQEGKPLLVAWDVAYWQKYVQLAQDLDAPAIERDILEIMSRCAEQLMPSLKR